MRQVLITLLLALPAAAFASNLRYDLIKEDHRLSTDNREILTYSEQTTILNSNGAIEAQKYPITYYPDTEQLKVLAAQVIKKNGNVIKVGKNQMFERNAGDDPNAPGFNNRMTMTVVFPTLGVGDKINIEYQLHHFQPQNNHENLFKVSDKNPVTKMIISYRLSKDHYLRWAEHGGFKVADSVNDEGIRIIRAVLKNQPATTEEISTADLGDNGPYFIVSTKSSWADVGENFYSQFQSKVIIDEKIRDLAKKITHGKKGYLGAQLLSNWVAQNIHYIAVFKDQSGGYVPHDVSEIINNGYGDCKDKALLLVTLLKAIGVKSQPVLIDADLNYFTAPIPFNGQFNHVIVYIPAFKLFTDPTNPYAEFGVLPYNDQDKFVVLVSKHSTTSKTPSTPVADKYYHAQKCFKIKENGDIKGAANITTKNRFSRTLRHMLKSNDVDTFVTNMLIDTEGGTGKFKSSPVNDLNKPITLKATWFSPQAIDIEPTSYFQLPNGFETWHTKFLQQFIQYTERTTPIYIGSGTMEWDNEYHLPKGYKVTHLPTNIKVNNAAGSLSAEYSQEPSLIKLHQKFVVNQDVFSPKEYPKLKELLLQVQKMNKNIVVITKG